MNVFEGVKPGKIKREGVYKMRQEMSKKAGRYMTINECIDQIEEDVRPVML